MKKKGAPPVMQCKQPNCNWQGRVIGQGRKPKCPKCFQFFTPTMLDMYREKTNGKK